LLKCDSISQTVNLLMRLSAHAKDYTTRV
jgi:hypothetical protein